jgi:hypothetical protein
MKKILLTILLIVSVIAVQRTLPGHAQDKPAAVQAYEYGIIKWEASDKVQLVYPTGSTVIHAYNSGARHNDATSEEDSSMIWAIEHVAKDGWEPVNLDGTRTLIRRPFYRKTIP